MYRVGSKDLARVRQKRPGPPRLVSEGLGSRAYNFTGVWGI